MTVEEVVASIVALSVVGRTGATGVAVVVPVPIVEVLDVAPGEGAQEMPAIQTRSAGQQPPPRVAGQA
jgi:hypothetical protein